MRRTSSTQRIGRVLAAVALLLASADLSAQYRDGRHGRGGPGRGAGYDRYGGRGDRPGPHDDRGYGDRDFGDRRGPPPGFGGRGDPRRGGYYGRHHRCRDSGTGGTIIGAIAGGLLGNSIAGYGDRAAGTIIGGGAGALAGRAIDRDC